MQGQEASFRPYWKREKERYEKEGILSCLDYPLFNDMINGMLFKSFDEILKTEDRGDMSYNPQKNKFITNYKLYLNEIARDLSKVLSVLEVNLFRIDKKILKTILPKLANLKWKFLLNKVTALYTKLKKVVDFQEFNVEILNHLEKKIAKQFSNLHINFQKEGIIHLLSNMDANIFYGNLRAQQTVQTLSMLIFSALEKTTMPNDVRESLQEINVNLEKMQEDIDMRRMRDLQAAPPERVQRIAALFEERKAELLKENEENFKVSQASSAKQAGGVDAPIEVDLLITEHKGEAEKSSSPGQDHITTPRPPGDKLPLELEDKESQDEEVSIEDPHTIRHYDRYYVDINQGFQSKSKACYNLSDPMFVLTHNFLYMLLYYGITPTTFDYNTYMDIPKNLFGLLSAVTPIVGCCSSFIYNYLTRSGYKFSYLKSLTSLVIGTFLYSLAFTYRSIAMLLIGRSLMGYGAGRILTRKFFSLEIHIEHRIFYSALLVGAVSLSMTLGPGFSALLETILDTDFAKEFKFTKWTTMTEAEKEVAIESMTSFKILGMKFCKFNYLSAILMLCFLTLWILYFFFFRDIPKKTPAEIEAAKSQKEREDIGTRERYVVSEINGLHFLPEDRKSLSYGPDERKKKLDAWKTKLSVAQKYFTDKQTYYVCAFFFVIKAIQECIIVESPSYIVKNYKYTSTLSGLIFFCFTVATLPGSLIPSLLKRKYEDRKMLLWGSIFFSAALIIKIQFTEELYPFWLFLLGSCAVLAISNSVETCCTSIITKVISEKKARSFLNAGLMSAIIDTLGRATGSISITVITSFVEIDILNCILYPFWSVLFFSLLIALIWMYSRLDTRSYLRFG